MTMEYTTALDIGRRKRQQGGINEDSVAVTVLDEGHRDTDRRSGVFVLADGAGGAQAGDVASYVTTVEVSRQLTDRLWAERELTEIVDAAAADSPESVVADAVDDPLAAMSDEAVQTCIAEAIEAAHARLLAVIDNFGLDNGYSTVVAAVAAGDRLHYGWVGDSRAYVVNVGENRDDDQRVARLTKDHSEVERLVSDGVIDEIEAHVHRRGNLITRALGGKRGEDAEANSVSVDTATVPLFGDDIVLLTSDGLIDAYTGAPQLHREYEDAEDTDAVAERILEKSVTDDEIREVILDAPSLEAAADRFVELSNERGGKDNLSLVLFRNEALPSVPGCNLPIRAYDPDPEEIINRDTVKQFPQNRSNETDAPKAGRPRGQSDPDATGNGSPDGNNHG